jgi:ATP phosphoribosyltransferase regulatory subunit
LAPALLEAAGVEGEARRRLARALDRKDAAAVAELAKEAGGAALLLPALLAAAGPAEGALAALEAAALPQAARAIADNAAAVIAALRARAPGLRVTLDPVEFRGFRYHTGVAFTIFGEGMTGEIARGGRYLSGEEPATGMSLYPDALLRAVAPAAPRARVFVPLGTDPEAARALRAQGLATIAQLAPGDTPESLRCTHSLDLAGALRPVTE